MKKQIIFITLLFFTLSSFGQILKSMNSKNSKNLKVETKIKWYSLAEAEKLQKESPKIIMIDFYTDWCGWCHKLDKISYSNDTISNYINRNFYPVKFNPETSDTITFNGKIYNSINTGKGKRKKYIQEFAIQALEGKLAYPSIIYLDENFNKVGTHGYSEPKNLMPILMYFAEKVFKSTSFENFKKYYDITNKAQNSKFSLLQWNTLEEMEKKNKENPKKILIHFYANWMKSSQMMTTSTFNDPVIASYLNEKFYCIHFNATSKDSIFAFGRPFINENKEHPFHQLTVAMLEGNMNFPVLVILDENMKLINRLQSYLMPEAIEPILHYFGENIHKTTDWQKFRETFKSHFNQKKPEEKEIEKK